MSITGKPTFRKALKVTTCPSTSALEAITMLALAPMSVPLPPKHAPKTSAHARGSIESPSTCSTICIITGTIVAVNGMLSTNDEKSAATQMMRQIAANCRDSTGTSFTTWLREVAMERSRPSSPSASMNTKSAAKKSKVSHSTSLRASWHLFLSNATSSHTAPMIATHAGSRCVNDCKKKEKTTQVRTVPHLTSRGLLVIG
mmetsp:Transcript_50142/g.122371  ORF Transcript_50142/g.122371 Transcript_50142/m.122371 type:complete len:201 (-) Transcript_50142:871-1473(-)